MGRWRFSTLNRHVDNSRDIADLDINLDLMPDKDRTVLRLALIGSLTVTDRAGLDACLDKYSRLFASLRVWDSHSDLAVIPADGEFSDLGIGGFAAAAVEELVRGRPRRRPQDRGRRPGGARVVVAADRSRPAGSGCGMKLHRLVLKNYRGIDYREIDFPDHGVVVVSGANEIGKSSMVEALDLLLDSKDRSTRKEVKQVKPTHADVGSEITAEISAGAYRFIYHKRFHKKPETQLTVLEPRREQHSGDEAHDRVQAMLAETVDTELWRAQRVLQAASTDAVNLSGCDALTRALDVAAGDAAALSGTEPLLIERIDSEYARYFTPTGRPTGEWTTAIKVLEAANQEVERCAAAVAEVDDRVQRHAALTVELAELTEQRQAAATRQTDAQAAADAIARLTEQVREAELIAAAATATSTASTAAHTERARLRTENDSRTAAVAALEDEVREATEAQAMARDVAVEADAAVESADQALAAAQQRAETARRLVDDVARREETLRLAAKLTKIDAALGERDEVAKELSTIALTDDLLRQIEQAAAAVERTESQLVLVSATVEFVAAADIELAIGDQRVSLPAGQSWSTVANTATEVDDSRRRDRSRHARHVRARHSGAIRCSAREVGGCAGSGAGRRSGRGAAGRRAAP